MDLGYWVHSITQKLFGDDIYECPEEEGIVVDLLTSAVSTYLDILSTETQALVFRDNRTKAHLTDLAFVHSQCFPSIRDLKKFAYEVAKHDLYDSEETNVLVSTEPKLELIQHKELHDLFRLSLQNNSQLTTSAYVHAALGRPKPLSDTYTEEVETKQMQFMNPIAFDEYRLELRSSIPIRPLHLPVYPPLPCYKRTPLYKQPLQFMDNSHYEREKLINQTKACIAKIRILNKMTKKTTIKKDIDKSLNNMLNIKTKPKKLTKGEVQLNLSNYNDEYEVDPPKPRHINFNKWWYAATELYQHLVCVLYSTGY
ncbi:hypothetical protein PCE1_002593 [Barthelona sp. PCE]